MLSHKGYEDLTRCMVETGFGDERVRCVNAPSFVATAVEPDEDDGTVVSMSVCASCLERDGEGTAAMVLFPRVMTPIQPSFLVVIKSFEGDDHFLGTPEELAEDMADPSRRRLPPMAEVWLRQPAKVVDRERLDLLIREAAARKEALGVAKRKYGEAEDRARVVRGLMSGADPELLVNLQRELVRVEALVAALKQEITS